MLKPRTELDTYLNKKFNDIAFDSKKQNDIFVALLNKHNIPMDLSADIIMQRRGVAEYDDFILFCILAEINGNIVDKYFTRLEIERYSNAKLEVEEIKFPYVFENVVQITPDQWITKTTAKELMLLKDSGIIRYNQNTQRAMTKRVRNGVAVFKISINKKQVGEIGKSMRKKQYIPDTITLNLPSEADFMFEDGQLIINYTENLDITDGYHRLQAIASEMNADDDFDYPMELRITNFAESKAQHFIFQMDQKTKMKKVDSESMNQDNPANIIVDRLNNDPACDLFGKITRTNSVISAAELSKYIDSVYGTRKMSNDRMFIAKATKDIRFKLNYLLQENPELYDSEWDEGRILSAVLAFKDSAENDVAEMLDLYKEYYSKICSISKDTAGAKWIRSASPYFIGKIRSKMDEMEA